MKVRSIRLILAALFVVLAVGAASAGVADLGGTSWRVVAYNVGKYNTLTPVRGDGEIRVVFGRNSRISGAGVNGFSAGYSASRSRAGRNSLAIRNAKFSGHNAYPNAVQRSQEQSILRAMSGAVSYRMAGGQLDLLYPNGRIAATLLTTDDLSVEVRRENILSHAHLVVPYDQAHLAAYPANVAVATTYTVYRNGFKEATIRPDGPDAVILTLDGEIFRLYRLREGSNVRFVERDDRTTELWESDGKITIVIRGHINSDFVPVN